MLINMLIKLLPKDKKGMIRLVMRMASRLDTARERREVAEYGMAAFQTGKISTVDWMVLGKKLGVLTGPANGATAPRTPRIPSKTQVGPVTTEANS
jgi:hypothetical protein